MKLELADEEVDLVFRAIQDLPFKQAAPLVQKIQKQFELAHEEANKEKPQVDTTHIKEVKKDDRKN